MFTLSEEPLSSERLASELQAPGAGARVCFEGRVRHQNDGRPVRGLEYEAYAEMAIGEGNRLIEEAKKRFSLLGVRIAHRVGRVEIGEQAVWVGVAAGHRQEAFLACRWLMDRIKAVVPIWKREDYADGHPAEWIHSGSARTPLDVDLAWRERYRRQIALPGIGEAGQRRLDEARVLVIGAGGLGCPALQYLAAAGVGNLTICDGDRVQACDLHRQVLYGESMLNRNKADAAAERLRDLNPQIAIRAVTEAASPETLSRLLDGCRLVLDCTDSFDAKYAIHDACWNAGVTLVQAAVYQFDGWVQRIEPGGPGGCFRCLWPTPPPAGCIGNCAEAGVLGVTPGLLGTLQAAEALKALLGLPDSLEDVTLYVDILSGRTERVRRTPRTDCPCRQGPLPIVDAGFLLEPGERAAGILRRALLVDLREAEEREGDSEEIQALPHMPRAQWPQLPERFPERPLVLCCRSGNRARQCLDLLGHPPGIYAWKGSIRQALACRQGTDGL
ncbi:MAG: ThiF family adenylyltransferase [Kiritimatiellia bacterium]|nr:ThiF family adenylyltransferase [Kiritimatiellia bacterium]